MRVIVGSMTPEQQERHERKLLEACLWMKKNAKPRVDGEAHSVALSRQVNKVRTIRAEAKAKGE